MQSHHHHRRRRGDVHACRRLRRRWIVAGGHQPGGGRRFGRPPREPRPGRDPWGRVERDGLLADVDIGGSRTMHLLCVGPTTPASRRSSSNRASAGTRGSGATSSTSSTGRQGRAPTIVRATDRARRSPAGGRRPTRSPTYARSLTAAKISPPYLLVGYSVGGWNVMVHADEHPDDVVGAVFVDVRPPAVSQRWVEALPPEASGEPEAIHLTRTDPVTFEKDPAQNPEGLLIADSAAEALATDDFGDRPLVVLAAGDTSGVTEGFDATLGATMVGIWWELQQELAARSTAGKLVKVEGATHEMPFERPMPSPMPSARCSAADRTATATTGPGSFPGRYTGARRVVRQAEGGIGGHRGVSDTP